METAISKKIVIQLDKGRKGRLIFPADFRGLGTEGAIKTVLSRLVKYGKLERITHGIYFVPKKDPILGILKPSLDEIAQAIAKRDHARIKPTGAYALNKLGLSTQVPMNIVYLTDGAPRQINVGKFKIKFKSTTPRKLSFKGEISGLVISALEEIGANGLTAELKEKLEYLLTKEEPKKLQADMKLAPAWIADILFYLTQKEKNHGAVSKTTY